MSALEWTPIRENDYPGDQQADLPGALYAQIGPDARRAPDGWSWSVIDFDADETIASGFAASEHEAKAAVENLAHNVEEFTL